ncbi:MAG TPA: hypothetical protein PKA28_13220 [Methylomusa anaerophila]|uniref:Uncharacterized protein n=1 Tax=Methylomusa anaerophila TaxID=1930071 RepID=A0A348AGR1_9FIRM|nr:hypothetical protein [Methylomusa anaerophila]BBB90259.1 hypothetical protein MAMMFC1_00907 [Methylomusa anaerophila]HML89395.1 hypothetical protein [Methylomusa anaerophila]
MSGLTSLPQSANSALGNVKGNSRILEAEIRADASRGVVIQRKLDNLEKLKQQEETAMNYLTDAVNKDAENTKNFLDSAKETMDKIDEEVKKGEEKTAENTGTETQTNAASQNDQDSDENSSAASVAGNIVDVVIPSTVIQSNLSAIKTNDTPLNTTETGQIKISV